MRTKLADKLDILEQGQVILKKRVRTNLRNMYSKKFGACGVSAVESMTWESD